MICKFNIRRQDDGIILQVSTPNPTYYVYEFYKHSELDRLNEEGIDNAFLRLQEKLKNELDGDRKIF